MTFRIALCGLNAAQADLNVTANNIANTATTGFKDSRAEFADLFAVSPQGVSSNSQRQRRARVGRRAAVRPGQHRLHRHNLDLAISGQGFFIAERQRRAVVHARRRVPGRSRRLRRQRRSSSACRCIRRSAAAASTPAPCRDLRLQTTESAPQATTNVEYVLNLPANAAPPPIATVRSERSEQLQPARPR